MKYEEANKLLIQNIDQSHHLNCPLPRFLYDKYGKTPASQITGIPADTRKKLVNTVLALLLLTDAKELDLAGALSVNLKLSRKGGALYKKHARKIDEIITRLSSCYDFKLTLENDADSASPRPANL